MIKQIYELDSYKYFIELFVEDSHYSDPHYTYSSDNLHNAFKEKDRFVCAVFHGEQIIGLFVFLILLQDKYIEMLIGFSKEEKAYEEVINKLKSEYKGFSIDFVYNPGNEAIQNVLQRLGAYFYPEQMKMIAYEPVNYQRKNEVQLFKAEYKEQYCMMHTKDTYWTSERILSATEKFKVFIVVKDKQVIGYLDVTYCFGQNEPYDLRVKEGYENIGIETDLLHEALEANLPNSMVVLIDVDNIKDITIYETAGFKKVEGQNSITATIKG